MIMTADPRPAADVRPSAATNRAYIRKLLQTKDPMYAVTLQGFVLEYTCTHATRHFEHLTQLLTYQP